MKQHVIYSLLASLICLPMPMAQAQDAAKVLNLFQSLLGGGQTATPGLAAPSTPGWWPGRRFAR